MLTEAELYNKRRTNSKRIGDVHDELEIIGSYRFGYGSFYEIKCLRCGHIFDKPVATWKHIKYCPMCKREKQAENKKKALKFDAPLFYKHRRLMAFAKKHNIPVDKEWESYEDFLRWGVEHGVNGAGYRMRHKKEISHVGPDTVRFSRVTHN